MDTYKQIRSINIIFFFSVLLCNSMSAMELTELQKNNAAKLFIQNFPNMTFAKAKTTFDAIQKPVQKMIWQKLEQDKENKELSVALNLALFPEKTLPYSILAETDTIPQEVQEKLAKKTILELFTRKAEVDQECTNHEYMTFDRGYNMGCYWHKKPITFTKLELLSITNHHVEIIKKKLSTFLTREELILLTELSDDLFNKLTIRKNIYFLYREGKLTIGQKIPIRAKAAFKVCKEILPYIIIPLLYSHFFLNPYWNSITGAQDPLQLEQNLKFEAANKAIDTLQKLNINGSEHLIKHIINEVPFTYSWSDWGHFAIPLSPLTLMCQLCAMLNNDILYRKDMSFKYKFDYCASIWLSICGVTAVLSPFLYFFSGGTLEKEGTTMLIALSCAATAGCIIGGTIGDECKASQWTNKSINFSKESIEQIINDLNIEIKENLNE